MATINPLGLFQFGATIKDFQKMGRGVLRVGLAFTANTDTNVDHKLGRIPLGVLAFCYVDPNNNPPATAVYVPKIKPSTATAWSNAQITIQMESTVTSLNAPVLWIF
jgi:hypothetical protein